jgi:hypothetical protein
MLNPEYQRSRRTSLWGLAILLVVVGGMMAGLFWMFGLGIFPLYIPLVPTVLAIPTISFFWWEQVRRWPPKDI